MSNIISHLLSIYVCCIIYLIFITTSTLMIITILFVLLNQLRNKDETQKVSSITKYKNKTYLMSND